MVKAFYEHHDFPDPSFPIIFHYNTLSRNHLEILSHWHINIELLYVIKGSILVSSNSQKIIAKPNDIIIINSNFLHGITCLTNECNYYCLIIDKDHCDTLGFDTTNNLFKSETDNEEIQNIFNLIIKEMINHRNYYKIATVALCTTMLILLFRHLWETDAQKKFISDSKTDIVKLAIEYINSNYQNELSIDQICSSIGVSKFYFCRIFKEITDKTIVEYINVLRTRQARFLIAERGYTIQEASEECGFNSVAYFSRCFKQFFGYPPSKEKKTRLLK